MKRRLEVVGAAGGVTVYDDFAHHPTAVAETLAGLRAANPDARIWAVFEPRSASSCRRVFQDDFARAFAGADEVLIAPVFRSKLPEAERLSVPQLVRRSARARAVGARSRVDRRHRRRHRRASTAPGDLVVLMSNGGFGGIHRKLLAGAARETVIRIVPAGDSALIVEFEERIDPVVNARTIACAGAIQAAGIAGVRDVVPTYRSVAVYFDPLRTDSDAADGADRARSRARRSLPADIDGAAGARSRCVTAANSDPTSTDVATFAGLTRRRRRARCTAPPCYRVFMLGFVPGFAYLGLVDERIAMPRRATPRVRVPAGSVGIAGVQTGIYPADTPGGWHIDRPHAGEAVRPGARRAIPDECRRRRAVLSDRSTRVRSTGGGASGIAGRG